MGKAAASSSLVAASKPVLKSLLSFRNVADRSVRQILGKLGGETHADSCDDRGFRKAAKKVFDNVLAATCLDFELQFSNGGSDTLPLARLELAFSWFAEECSCFGKLLKVTCLEHGNLMSLVLYCDEVTPGNPLRPDNMRKSYLFYISIVQFKHKLRSEHAWIPVFIIKHVSLDKLEGGLTRLCADVLRVWSASGLFSHGCVMDLDGQPILVRFRRKVRLLVDYAAACDAWASKTASGLRPCTFYFKGMLVSSPCCLMVVLCCDMFLFSEPLQEKKASGVKTLCCLQLDWPTCMMMATWSH